MASTAFDKERVGTFHGPLPNLNIRRMYATERINDLYEIRVDLVSDAGDLDFEKLLGKRASVELTQIDGTPRWFTGVIADCQWTGGTEQHHGYSLTLRPGLWMSTLRRNQRIFHDMSPIKIIEKVLGAYSEVQVSNKASGLGETLEYTVQYRETDFDFVCRLLERFGVNYVFEMNGKSTPKMVLVDSNSSFPKVSGTRKVSAFDRKHVTGEERFWEWSRSRRLVTGKVELSDFNFKTPKANMAADMTGETFPGNRSSVAYDFPGGYLASGAGKKVATIRAEQEIARDHRQYCEGDALSVFAGALVKVEPDGGRAEEFLCLEVSHAFTGGAYATGGNLQGEEVYSATYTMYPSKPPYRPARSTPEARIDGPQTATVVGKKGEDIDVDEHGRILVHFPWDRDKAYSMRVRCAQMWAHNGWGTIFTPRVGMEVLVVFIEGDPDNPLVVGCVYNGANKPPWKLPADKNTAGIKSRSTKSGGANNYNELAFDDTKGKELFRQQAEKDMQTLVKHCEKRQVDVDRTTLIGQDEKREVKRHEEHKIGENQTWEIGKDSDWKIGKNEKRKVGSNRTTDIGSNEKLDVGSNRTTDVGVNDTLKVGSKLSMKANAKIELVCGKSKITMTPASIKIESIAVTVEAKAMLKSKGALAKHEASGIMTIKGAMVMIN